MRIDGNAITARQPFQSDAQMHLALAANDCLGAFLIVLDAQRRVLIGNAVQRGGELDFVLALLRPHSDRHDGIRLRRSLQERGRLFGRAEYRAGGNRVELAKRHGIAKSGARRLPGLLAHHGEKPGHFARCAAHGDFHSVARHSRQDTDHRELSGMGGVNGFHHLQHRAVRFDAEALGSHRAVGRIVPDGFEQPRDAVAVFCRADEHRHDRTVAQVRCQIVKNFVFRRINILQQLFHQRVVMVRQSFQHGVARLNLARLVGVRNGNHFALGMLAENIGALRRKVDCANRDSVFPDRNLPQQQRGFGGWLKQRQQIAHRTGCLVNLVQKQHMRQADILKAAQHKLERRDLFLVRLSHHDCHVGGGEHRLSLVGELDGTGAVNEGQALAHVGGGGDGGFDAHLVRFGLRGIVADRGAGAGLGGFCNRFGAFQQRLEQRGFARCEGPDNGDTFRTR